MASIEKYQEFLSDIMSSSDISVENKKILYNVLNTSEMQAKIPNESLKDLSESIKASATSTKISPAAILAEVTTIQQKAQKFEQSREENREGTNNSQDQDFSAAAFSSFVSSQITEELLNNIRERYPETSEEAIITIAEEQIANDIIDRKAPKEEAEAIQKSDIEVAIGKEAAKKSEEVAGVVFSGKGKIDISAVFQSITKEYGEIAAEISKNFDLTTEEGLAAAAQECLYGDKYSSEEKKILLGYLFDVGSLYYKQIMHTKGPEFSNGSFRTYTEDTSIYDFNNIDYEEFARLKVESARAMKQTLLARAGRNEPVNYEDNPFYLDTLGYFRFDSYPENDLDNVLEEQGIQIDNFAKNHTANDEQALRDAYRHRIEHARELRQKLKEMNKANLEFDSIDPEEPKTVSFISQEEFSWFAEAEGEELPAEKVPQKDSYRAPNVEPADLSISPEEFMGKFDLESSTPQTPQESGEVTFDITDFDFNDDFAIVDKAPSEEIEETIPEATAVEHDPDAGLDALARGEKEVEREPEEVVAPPQPEQDVSYNWRDVLRGFINRITGKTKAISAPQKQQGQDESMPEPPKGNEVKKNDDSFFSRIAKALGMKKEEPQPIAPETEAKPEATIETSDVFSHVAVDVEKAVQQAEAQAKANKEDPNLKKKLDDPTQEQ